MKQEIKKSVLRAIRLHWMPVIATAWALWMTYAIQSTREDIDHVSGQVSALEETVRDQDQSDELEEIKTSIANIVRRLPY